MSDGGFSELLVDFCEITLLLSGAADKEEEDGYQKEENGDANADADA